MKRLFTFGCSFTNYVWPTWADILADQFEQAENWGQAGASNHFIANSLVECHLRRQISHNDVVAIMWTHCERLDSYKQKTWLTPGNAHNQTVYPKAMIDQYDTRGFYIRDLALMYMINQLVDSLGCEFYQFSMLDMDQAHENDIGQKTRTGIDPRISDLLVQYKSMLDRIRPSVHKVIFNHDWFSRPFREDTLLPALEKHYENMAGSNWPKFENIFDPACLGTIDRRTLKEIFNLNKWDWKQMLRFHKRTDLHPTPCEHLEYLNLVLPEYKISNGTIDKVQQLDLELRANAQCNRDVLPERSPERW